MKNKVYLILSLILPIIVFYIYKVNYGYIYHAVDDVAINYSILTHQNMLLPYVGIILTSFLVFIQLIFQTINIYFCCLILLYCLSFSVYIHAVKHYQAKYLLIPFILIIEYISLKYFTYSVIAYLVSAAGILLMFKGNKKVWGSVMFFIGISLRPQIIVSLMILAVPILAYEFFVKKQKNKIILLLSIILVVIFSNKLFIKQDKTLEEYISWNEKSTLIRDYPAIQYKNHKDEFEKFKISKNDLESYNSWIFAEKNVFSKEMLSKVDEIRSFSEKYETSKSTILISFLSNNIFKVLVLFSTILLIFFYVKNICGYGLFFLPLVLILGLLIRQRVVERIYIPIILISIIFIIGYFKDFFNKRSYKYLQKTESTIFTVVCILLFGYVIYFGKNNLYWFLQHKYYFNSEYNKLLKNNPDKLYIFVGYSNLMASQPDMGKVFVDRDKLVSNGITMGTWQTFTPQYYSQLENLGIDDKDNLLSSAENNKNIKFIMDKDAAFQEQVRILFKEHYNKNVYFEKESDLAEQRGIYSLRRG
ncbi:hypothetical protein [Gemella cuniculi]|uniref:hypothetical protein n=1 Tax=Gemella cuniculi TaxID=150240 RepID=UPI0004193578|nr:hypothetical protein [Gemella cuniculi]